MVKVKAQKSYSVANKFSHMAAQFLANTPIHKTREIYGRELGFFISWFSKNSSITNITLEDLLRYKIMLEKQYSPATVMKKTAALQSFFRFARAIGAISDNPAGELRVTRPTRNHIPTYLTVEEVQRLIRMPDGRTMLGKRDAAILALLPNSGMRREEGRR